MGGPRILIVMDHYLPGIKAGGPVTAIRSLVACLGREFRFHIVAADRDLGDTVPYAGVTPGAWTETPAGCVCYLPPDRAGVGRLTAMLRSTAFDALYLNSYWSRRATLFPLIARRRAAPSLPLILAPRGEFSAGALALKHGRKRLYRLVLTLGGLARDAVWQASSEHEAADIRRVIGPGAMVHVAPDLPLPLPELPRRAPKVPGRARFALVGRISPMKNVAGAIATLAGLRGDVGLTIYGPEEDAAYAGQCRRAVAALPDPRIVHWGGVLAPEAVPAVMSGADAFLLPSLGENFGHVILEALGAGCPVVISDRTPWRGLQARGVGWDLPLEAPHAFTAALQAIVDMDEPTHARMRRAARGHAETVQHEDWRVEANRRLLWTAMERCSARQ